MYNINIWTSIRIQNFWFFEKFCVVIPSFWTRVIYDEKQFLSAAHTFRTNAQDFSHKTSCKKTLDVFDIGGGFFFTEICVQKENWKIKFFFTHPQILKFSQVKLLIMDKLVRCILGRLEETRSSSLKVPSTFILDHPKNNFIRKLNYASLSWIL